MTDKNYGAVSRLKISQIAHAFLLEEDIANRQRFINDQNVRVDMSDNRKGQPDIHPAGISLDRLINKVANIGEGHDFVKSRIDIALAQAEYLGIALFLIPI